MTLNDIINARQKITIPLHVTVIVDDVAHTVNLSSGCWFKCISQPYGPKGQVVVEYSDLQRMIDDRAEQVRLHQLYNTPS